MELGPEKNENNCPPDDISHVILTERLLYSLRHDLNRKSEMQSHFLLLMKKMIEKGYAEVVSYSLKWKKIVGTRLSSVYTTLKNPERSE